MSRRALAFSLSFRNTVLSLAVMTLFLMAGSRPAAAAMENHFLYFPNKHLYATPAQVGLEYSDVFFQADDRTKLHGWFIPGASEKPAVLFCHGNAGNIADRIDNLLRLHQAGFPVFIFDYRGYGQSDGKPTEQGTYSDGRGALAWLARNGYPPEQTVYFGRSLGAAVALQLALEQPPAGLILESPFTSVAAMGRYHYPLLSRLFGWLLSADYDNREKIVRINSPLLLIHGTADTIVPVEMGKELHDLAPEPKQLYLVEGADHNDGFYIDDKNYWDTWHLLTQGKGRASNDETD